MSGNCATGKRKEQMEPASTKMTAIADAKIGRWMKKPTMLWRPALLRSNARSGNAAGRRLRERAGRPREPADRAAVEARAFTPGEGRCRPAGPVADLARQGPKHGRER